MTASPSHHDVMRDGVWIDVASRSDADLLRTVVVAVGLSWSAAFVAIGLGYELQLFGDGSIFSYAVAVDSAWAIHWHNISGRLFVYLFSILPAEVYVELTKDAHGAIVVYGLLHFAAPLLGLLATWAADRSKDHIIFVYACLSTAFLGPLVFGFPTEMWIAHALFWPALAICHYRPRWHRRFGVVFAVLLALAFTHEGALVFVAAIVTTLLMRGKARRGSEMHGRFTHCHVNLVLREADVPTGQLLCARLCQRRTALFRRDNIRKRLDIAAVWNGRELLSCFHRSLPAAAVKRLDICKLDRDNRAGELLAMV